MSEETDSERMYRLWRKSLEKEMGHAPTLEQAYKAGLIMGLHTGVRAMTKEFIVKREPEH